MVEHAIPSMMTSDMLKYATGRPGIGELLKVYQNIMRSKTVPIECSDSLTIQLYMGTWDALQCGMNRTWYGYLMGGYGIKA